MGVVIGALRIAPPVPPADRSSACSTMRRRAASLLSGRLAGLAAEQQTQGLATSATSPTAALFGISGRASRSGRNVAQQQARGRSALPAAAAAVQTRVAPQVLPLTRVDEFGATSILESEDMAKYVPQQYENVDGRRIEDGRYAAFTKDLTGGWELGAGPPQEGSVGVFGTARLRLLPAAAAWWVVAHQLPACQRPPGPPAGAYRRTNFQTGHKISPGRPRCCCTVGPQAACCVATMCAELAGVPKERQFTDKVRGAADLNPPAGARATHAACSLGSRPCL